MSKPKPTQASFAAQSPNGPRGRFIGLVATGKGRYQVHLLETVGETVVKREVVYPGITEVRDGKPVTGNAIHVALADLNVLLMKRLREATDLWADGIK